jgi:dTDP-4-dehydrorhamnose 3,5-epimerase
LARFVPEDRRAYNRANIGGTNAKKADKSPEFRKSGRLPAKICDFPGRNIMPVQTTSIDGLLVIRWQTIEDSRGFFKHSYQASELAALLGHEPLLRQGNHSRSRANVLRGFHAEPWDKLVYVPRGTAMCVVADVRPDSSSFGCTQSFTLGDPPGEHIRLFISQGLANAFYCFTETDYINDVSAEFDPRDRRGVAWNDPTLGVDWPTESPVVSGADSRQPSLQSQFPDHPIFRHDRLV